MRFDMFNCSGLYKSDLIKFQKLNDRRKEFNELNENFFDEYYSLGYTFQLFLLKKVKILKYDSDFLGFLWVNSWNRYNTNINAISVVDSIDMEKGFNTLISSIKGNPNLNYSCTKNDFNFQLLSKSGFKKTDGTLELSMNLAGFISATPDYNISFDIVDKYPLEKARCDLQNEIFKVPSRLPLTIADIYFDETQKYYLKAGSILLKYKDTYIGYGQIIIEFNHATIVNFGVLKKYRNRGFGKMLLSHLLNITIANKHNVAYIKVKSDNAKALILYKSCGFKVYDESCNWVLNR